MNRRSRATRRVPLSCPLIAGAICTILTGCSTTGSNALGEEETGAAAEAVCAGPGAVVTETHGPYATISIYHDAVFGDFYANGTILRASDSTACVGRIRAQTTGKSLAGQMTVTSPFLAKTGAPSATIIVDADPLDNEYFFVGGPPFVFPRDRSVGVRVETTGASGIPALPATVLRSASFPFLEVTRPLIPPAGEIVIPSDHDFRVVWKMPARRRHPAAGGGDGECGEDARVVVSLWFISGTLLDGEIRCGFPVSARQGVIPASLLGEMRERISPDSSIGALLDVKLGDQREVRPDGASYVLELGSFDSTTIGQQAVILD